VICFDTNIIIYIGNGTLTEDIIGDEPICYASITLIESLGYTDILSAEEQRIKELLATISQVPLSDEIIQAAVQLRQFKRMSLGDAIIAATAIEQNCQLWTVNEDDFKGIPDLIMYNPLKA
jgi:predicted nucleic acid-binding protein